MNQGNETIRAAIAVRLREVREKAGLTPSEVARRTGMAIGNYYQLERGSGNPTVATVIRIAEGLEVDPGDLLRGLGR